MKFTRDQFKQYLASLPEDEIRSAILEMAEILMDDELIVYDPATKEVCWWASGKPLGKLKEK